MSYALPYTFYACPCTNITEDTSFEKLQFPTPPDETSPEDEERALDPMDARANHVLYPLENLLFCNECHEIRCPRCWNEEVLYYYCPNCLMETTSTTVRTETNRCTRSCLQCPVCSTSLQLQSLADSNSSTAVQPKDSKTSSSRENGPFVLACPYCAWSTLEAGVKLDKSINLISQLAKLEQGGSITAPTLGTREREKSAAEVQSMPQTHFDSLKEFYRSAIAETNPTGPMSGLGSSFGLDSPSHLSRLLNQYGIGGLKKQRQKPQPMRESVVEREGLITEHLSAEDDVIERMKSAGWEGTASVDQQAQQLPPPGSRVSEGGCRFVEDLRPSPVKLRSRRAKRCQECRYHLLRPDDKRHGTRYKVRLLALNYVPRIVAAPLNADATDLQALRPGVTQQYLLTCRNPLYDPLKVRLLTPSTIPRASGSRITILCPQFDVGASTDVWDEALNSSKSAEAEGTSSRGTAEAGKVWKKGRNWTSVVLEVLPGLTESAHPNARHHEALEIPIFVRMEYSTDASAAAAPGFASPESSPGYKSVKEEKVSKEIEFWVVVSLGKMANSGDA